MVEAKNIVFLQCGCTSITQNWLAWLNGKGCWHNKEVASGYALCKVKNGLKNQIAYYGECASNQALRKCHVAAKKLTVFFSLQTTPKSRFNQSQLTKRYVATIESFVLLSPLFYHIITFVQLKLRVLLSHCVWGSQSLLMNGLFGHSLRVANRDSGNVPLLSSIIVVF